jgi:hypothetical protein
VVGVSPDSARSTAVAVGIGLDSSTGLVGKAVGESWHPLIRIVKINRKKIDIGGCTRFLVSIFFPFSKPLLMLNIRKSSKKSSQTDPDI